MVTFVDLQGVYDTRKESDKTLEVQVHNLYNYFMGKKILSGLCVSTTICL